MSGRRRSSQPIRVAGRDCLQVGTGRERAAGPPQHRNGGAAVVIEGTKRCRPNSRSRLDGQELSSGQYETRFRFDINDSWKLSLTVAQPDKAAVSIPLNLQVATISPN